MYFAELKCLKEDPEHTTDYCRAVMGIDNEGQRAILLFRATTSPQQFVEEVWNFEQVPFTANETLQSRGQVEKFFFKSFLRLWEYKVKDFLSGLPENFILDVFGYSLGSCLAELAVSYAELATDNRPHQGPPKLLPNP